MCSVLIVLLKYQDDRYSTLWIIPGERAEGSYLRRDYNPRKAQAKSKLGEGRLSEADECGRRAE